MTTSKTSNKIYNFFKVRWGELNNITWPTKKQALHSMVLVLVIMLIVGIFLGFIDAALSKAVFYLIG